MMLNLVRNPSEINPQYAAIWRGLRGLWLPSPREQWLDHSGNSNHGAYTNMSASDWAQRIGHRFWPPAPGLGFNGTGSSLVNCGSHDALDNIWTGGGTVAVWCYPFDYGQAGNGMLMSRTLGSSIGWLLYTRVTNAGFSFYHAGGVVGQWTFGTSILNRWNHLVIVYDKNGFSSGTAPAVYLDGLAVTPTTASTSSGTPTDENTYNFIIGNRADFAREFNGFLGMVGLWKRRLSANEAAQLYTAGVRPFLRAPRRVGVAGVGGTLYFATLSDGIRKRDAIAFGGSKTIQDGISAPDNFTKTTSADYSEIQEVLSALINTANITQLNAQDLVSTIQSQINISRLDSLGLPDALIKAMTTAKTDTFSIEDSVAKLTGIVQLIAFLTSDSLALQAQVVQSEGVGSDDSIVMDASKVQSAGLKTSDSNVLDSSKVQADVLETSDSNVLDSSKVQADVLETSDSNVLDSSKVQADVLETSDSNVLDLSKVQADVLETSDSNVLDLSKVQADVLETSDSNVLDLSKVQADVLETSDSNVLDLSKPLSEGLESLDSKAVLLSLFTDDIQQFNDSTSLLTFVKQLSQAAHSEDLSLDGQLIRSASVKYQDSLNNSVSVTLGEILSLLDAIQTSFIQFVTVLEGVKVSESMTPVIGKAPIDTASLLDSLTQAMTTAVTETVSWLPYLNYLTATTKTDSEGFIDTLVSQTVESLIDSLSYDEAIQASITVLRSDITTLLDTVARTTFETFSETFSLSDSVASSIVILIIGHVSAILVKALYNVDIEIKPTYSVDIEVK
jgi:hypothetical protein